MQHQFLDKMDLERERGITIKARPWRRTRRTTRDVPVQPDRHARHVDFSTKSPARWPPARRALVVDAPRRRGADARERLLAMGNNLRSFRLQQIDLPSAHIDRARREVEEVVVSRQTTQSPRAARPASLGANPRAIVKYVPPPKGEPKAPCARSWSTAGTTATGGPSCCAAWSMVG